MSKYPESLERSDKGLSLGGVTLNKLAKDYGTPLYVLDKQTIQKNCRQYSEPLKKHFPKHQLLYAGKANLNIGLLNIIAEEGFGLDVVSGGELYTALQSRIQKDKIYFHGNNKSLEELKMAIDNGVTLVIDNHQELKNIVHILSENLSAKAFVMVRLKPEIDAHTHDYIKTGNIDSKFGVDQLDLLGLIKEITHCSQIVYKGIHSHIGSQIFESMPYQELVGLMVGHLKKIKEELGLDTIELNIGGGVGIGYTDEDKPLDLSEFLETISKVLLEQLDKAGLIQPTLLLEPGRSIVGNAGLTLYGVGAVKQIQDLKTYLFVDGGMADNPRPMMYQSKYTFDVASGTQGDKVYSIAGKFCESGDILAEDIELPEVNVGDVLVVYGTGAYNYVMASNYNRACRPAMVLVDKGRVSTLVQRERYEDLIRLDLNESS